MTVIIARDITTTSMQAALERAAVNRTEGRVATRSADGSYTVPSAHGDTSYTVLIINLTQLAASCTCKHGTSGAPGQCWHSLSAMASEVRRLGGKYRVQPSRRSVGGAAFAASLGVR